MLRTRVIPCLLLRGGGLYKTIRFKDPRYVGDPINAVRIFNDKEVDEIVVLDIGATREGAPPDMARISDIASEAFMPMCYGGGVRTTEHLRALFAAGIEKVAINTAAVEDPSVVTDGAGLFGSQSIVVSIDVERGRRARTVVKTHGGTRDTGLDPVTHARSMESAGAGELFVNSIDRDGTGQGYDLDLIASIASAVTIPVVACGGAATLEHIATVTRSAGAAAAAAGSMFVFHGKHRAVLISYPSTAQRRAAFD